MRIVTRTIYGSYLQTCLLLGLPHEIRPNTTLNEKFNIHPDKRPSADLIPHVKYFAIGNNGHRVMTGADGIAYTTPVNHRGSDAALYNHIPFVLRKANEDLSITERGRYALRRVETHNDIQYIAYYLKRLNFDDVYTQMLYTQIEEGESHVNAFIPDQTHLNPEHPTLPHSGVITTDGSYLTSSALITILFNEQDVGELMNVAHVLYNNEHRAVISEIALCSGVDEVVAAQNDQGQSFNYKEAIGVQVATHITGYYPVGFTNKGFDLGIEAGATEPLLGEGEE